MISEMELDKLNKTMGTVFLDPEQKSPRAQDFEERLSARIVGQERAVRRALVRQCARKAAPRSPGRAGFFVQDPGRLCPWFCLVCLTPFPKSCSSSLHARELFID